MSTVKLCDVLYTPLGNAEEASNIVGNAALIDQALQQQIARIGSNHDHHYAMAGHHYFCSTIEDTVFTSDAINARNILSNASAVPQSFSSAYECACWGYMMRHHLLHKPEQHYFAISILDVNAMDLAYWVKNDQWGKSGFGITTLFFKVEQNAEPLPIQTGMSKGGNNIIGFASFAKAVIGGTSTKAIALPFFPDSMSVPVRNVLKAASPLSEYHADIGHAFGSDPWIAFIKDILNKGLQATSVVFGSLALRGYYCFADIKISEKVNAQWLTH